MLLFWIWTWSALLIESFLGAKSASLFLQSETEASSSIQDLKMDFGKTSGSEVFALESLLRTSSRGDWEWLGGGVETSWTEAGTA